MHLADFIDVVVQASNFGFFFVQDRLGLVHGPGKVVSIVIHGIIGVLRRVESAVLPIA